MKQIIFSSEETVYSKNADVYRLVVISDKPNTTVGVIRPIKDEGIPSFSVAWSNGNETRGFSSLQDIQNDYPTHKIYQV